MQSRSVESTESEELPPGIDQSPPGEVLVTADLDLQEAPAPAVIFSGIPSYGDYHDAGGIFNKEHYLEVFSAGIDGLNGHGDFQPIHLIQARSLASFAELPPDQVKAVAPIYAVLMEAATCAPSLAPWAGKNIDQVIFAEALRVTHGGDAFLAFTSRYPSIWRETEAEEEAAPTPSPRSTILAVNREQSLR